MNPTTILVLIASVFLVAGCLALINMMLGNLSPLDNPKEISLTPIAAFLISLGFMGLIIVSKIPCNEGNGKRSLARKQFFIGFSLIFICTVFLPILMHFAYN